MDKFLRFRKKQLCFLRNRTIIFPITAVVLCRILPTGRLKQEEEEY